MRTVLLVMLLMVAGICQAQQVKVEETEQTVNGVMRRGQQLTVQLDPKFVEKYWKDHLGNKAGKVKYNKGIYTIESAVIDTISNKPMRVLSTVGSGTNGSFVWWSLDMGVAYVDKSATPQEYAAAENFMRGFARKVYREDVLRQINEAEEVLRATKLEQDRVVKQANDIQLNIEKNKKRKQELEAELVRNGNDLKQLEQEVVNNQTQQEVSRQRVQDMEKAVEAVRAKLLQIK
ncbi:DNA repair ATPase [Pontibacter cellulosilyticus]|uniref:DNA repair ATPase n=1 Tax=Pontibacter cellulosilyticus TaxID=1720253 RepID=A0A923N5S4_9BACT|nr:DNA repair ATPase [Pontibacter cellulosilyticus]MBC5993118.1 DNA repair ATPase [Pontibacter cellulosilyticus]